MQLFSGAGLLFKPPWLVTCSTICTYAAQKALETTGVEMQSLEKTSVIAKGRQKDFSS